MASAPVCPSSPQYFISTLRASRPWMGLSPRYLLPITCPFNDLQTYHVLEQVLGLFSNELPPPKHLFLPHSAITLCHCISESQSLYQPFSPVTSPSGMPRTSSLNPPANPSHRPSCLLTPTCCLQLFESSEHFGLPRVCVHSQRCQACLLTLYHPL